MKSSKEFTVDNMPAYCPNVPQQTNLTDCGLFLLQYVESFYQNPLTSLQTPLQDLQDWFTAECITDKRYQIAHLIQDLAHNTTLKYPDLEFGQSESASKIDIYRVKSEKTDLPQSIQPDCYSSQKRKIEVKEEPDDSKKKKEVVENIVEKEVVEEDQKSNLVKEETKDTVINSEIEVESEKIKEELEYLSSVDWLSDY